MNNLNALENFQLAATELNKLILDVTQPFSVRNKTIPHPSYSAAIRRIAGLHNQGRERNHGGGLLLTGHSGVGKSMALNYYKSQFPAKEEPEGRVIPVLFVITPAAPTVKNLAESILEAMGDPFSGKGTSEEKTRRIYLYLKKCRVELILIDEFQHFFDTKRRTETRTVTDWLKNLLTVAKIPVVLAGLPRSELVIRSNPQLSRRFSSRFNIPPFSFAEEHLQKEFRGVLKGMSASMPLACLPLHDANVARRIFIATNGVMDYICKLLDQAYYLARRSLRQEITLDILSQAFLDEIWRDCPNSLNPFSPDSILRPLMHAGEPFESHAESAEMSRKARNAA